MGVRFLLFSFFLNCFLPSSLLALEIAPKISDREILEKLVLLEAGQKEALRRFDQIDKRFDRIDKRFEKVDKRFEKVDKRFEKVDKHFAVMDKRFENMQKELHRQGEQLRSEMSRQADRLISIISTIVLAFAGIVAVTISFAIWDRRTMTRPFEDKIKVVEAEIAQNRKKLHALLESLTKLGQTDEPLAKVLRSFNLM